VTGTAVLVAAIGTGCAADGSDGTAARPAPRPSVAAPTSGLAEPATEPATPGPPATAAERAAVSTDPAAPAGLSIPAIGVRSLQVLPYRGEPDDAPGTRIQNRGIAASPRGPRGGVAPGDVGNYIVTGHRLSAGGPLRLLPELGRGDRVLVAVQDTVYVYEVRRTLRVSFRSEASKALQTAPVPGHPRREATRPMITLSTCATLEDHAAGNFWSDRFGNPEHRIAKIGLLVDVRPR
jgi:sortase A